MAPLWAGAGHIKLPKTQKTQKTEERSAKSRMFFVQLITERKSIKTNSFSTTINKWECATQTAAALHSRTTPQRRTQEARVHAPAPVPDRSPSAVPTTSAARCCFLPWRFLCPSGADHLFFCAEHFAALHKRPHTAYSIWHIPGPIL